ncbi:syntaxin-1A-like [Thrips palmi]|uniref:Syntaxin-1A-like n=1 Tax=Thrips palmi TaxID=161013 RepID=A0A6P9AC37_THRPL|nr:syntaxin-1A-like [Thrips palmi]
MKDRLAELHQEVVDKLEDQVRSTQWYDVPVKKSSFKHTDERPLLEKSKSITQKFLRKEDNKSSVKNAKTDRFLANLQAKMQIIKSEVSTIQCNTKEITALHTKALMVPRLAPEEEMRIKELEQKTREANGRITKLMAEVESMNVPDSAPIQRIHSVQLSQGYKSIEQAMGRYEAELRRYAKALHQQVAQQMAIANGGRCDSGVVDAYIENGKLGMFVDNYLTTEQEARTMLQDVQDRHKELLALEKSIVEVQELFVCIHQLTEHQGDMIDSIEAHVEAANAKVADGSKNLKSAKKKQKSARKKKVILSAVGAAVATGLIATLILV